MKYFLIIVALFVGNSFSYSLQHISTVPVKKWNEIMDSFIEMDMSIYFGESPDKKEETLLYVIDDSFEDFRSELSWKRCSKKELEKDNKRKKKKCSIKGNRINNDLNRFNSFQYILNKSLEWSEVALENDVGTYQKVVENEKGQWIMNPFDYKATFYANTKAKQTDLIIVPYFKIGGRQAIYISRESQQKLFELGYDEITAMTKENNKDFLFQ